MKKDKTYWLDNPANIKKILYVFYAFCGLLFAADFFVNRYTYHDWEKIPAFYAIFGFVAYVLIVAIAALLRKLVMRDENYYSRKGEK